MLRRSLYLFFSFLFSIFLQGATLAQPPIEWQRSLGTEYEEQMHAMTQTSDGGFILAGISKSPAGHGSADVAVIRVDRNGSLQWRKLYGGSYFDETTNIIQTTDGGFILAGSSDSKDGDISAHHGNINIKDAWVVKLNDTGAIEWQRSIGGDQEDAATSICQTPDGSFVIAGITYSNANGDISDSLDHGAMLIAKLSAQGDLLWAKTYDTSSILVAFCIETTRDGGFIVGASGSGINPDAMVVKLDSLANIEWMRTFGGGAIDYLSTIRQTTDGGYIGSGSSSSSDGDLTHNFGIPGSGTYDAWFAKLDADGNRVWLASYGGSEQDIMTSIRETSDGGFIAAGETSSPGHDVIGYHGSPWRDAWIVKLSATGDMQWNRAYGGSLTDYARDVIESSNGTYVFVATTLSTDGDVDTAASGDVWLVKLGTGSEVTGSDAPAPATLTIESLFENPATDADLTCRFRINRQGQVVLSICNVLGQIVSHTDYGILTHGDHTREISIGDLPSGTYICKLSLNGFETSQRFSVQR